MPPISSISGPEGPIFGPLRSEYGPFQAQALPGRSRPHSILHLRLWRSEHTPVCSGSVGAILIKSTTFAPGGGLRRSRNDALASGPRMRPNPPHIRPRQGPRPYWPDMANRALAKYGPSAPILARLPVGQPNPPSPPSQPPLAAPPSHKYLTSHFQPTFIRSPTQLIIPRFH